MQITDYVKLSSAITDSGINPSAVIEGPAPFLIGAILNSAYPKSTDRDLILDILLSIWPPYVAYEEALTLADTVRKSNLESWGYDNTTVNLIQTAFGKANIKEFILHVGDAVTAGQYLTAAVTSV